MERIVIWDGKRGTGKTTRALAECVDVAMGGRMAVYVAPTHQQAKWAAQHVLKAHGTDVKCGDGRVILTTVESAADRVTGLRVPLLVFDGVNRMREYPEDALRALDPDGRLIEVYDAEV